MKKHIPLALRIIVAIILIQTLRFKFTAHPDSVYIFETVGLEPFGRIGIGVLELIAGILLLIPKTVWLGASITIGVISGAIFMHLTKLGIDINNDGGILFFTAVATFVLSAIILYIYRKDIPFINK
ncbi:DoxX family membrane protein [Jejuia spongiicola]|uniref:DoxX family membrane protein n=1 Tax=Jejuia spongiicola TaxID=2942207 RepID=A0ABT0QHM8_9FLAO|nr:MULTISPECIES: DoxX family membrane protein [Flavobacteriaceae]MCL6295973.1 DoxX family membrane protein [Jejuia spongiicola]PIA82120.1 DoxX family protein [Gaetbulibacter sp. 4G1]